MTHLRLTNLLAAGLPLLSAFWLAGCGGAPVTDKVEARTEKRDPREVSVNKELLQQIKLGQPHWANVAEQLVASGRIEANESRMSRISAPVAGRITELDVVVGQLVKRGQQIATLYSTDLSDAQFNFLRAFSQQALAQRSVARAKQLVEADVIGTAELQRREAELMEANAELASLRDQLRVLGLSEEQISKIQNSRSINSLTPIASPIDGTIVERQVTFGQVVQPADALAVVADLSNVWLVADIPETAAGNITIDRHVEAEIPALPEMKIRGKLTFVSAVVNPETRTVRVRMDLANPKGRLKPAMLAMMTIKDTPERKQVIPATAIVREGNIDAVFVQTDEDTFLMKEVDLGTEYNGGRVLNSGLAGGEKVVLQGAFHLNTERKRQALASN